MTSRTGPDSKGTFRSLSLFSSRSMRHDQIRRKQGQAIGKLHGFPFRCPVVAKRNTKFIKSCQNRRQTRGIRKFGGNGDKIAFPPFAPFLVQMAAFCRDCYHSFSTAGRAENGRHASSQQNERCPPRPASGQRHPDLWRPLNPRSVAYPSRPYEYWPP